MEGSDFSYAKLSHDEPKIGQWVLAVGNPFGLGGTVTAGIVSAEDRDIGSGPYDHFLQIDAPVNRGNSGGPTFNTRGEVIGVNTAIFSPSGGNVGIAFAIPAKRSRPWSATSSRTASSPAAGSAFRSSRSPRTSPSSLGIESTDGAIVADAQADGPAAAAGIKAGDIITKVDDKQVKDPKELSETIATSSPSRRSP